MPASPRKDQRLDSSCPLGNLSSDVWSTNIRVKRQSIAKPQEDRRCNSISLALLYSVLINLRSPLLGTPSNMSCLPFLHSQLPDQQPQFCQPANPVRYVRIYSCRPVPPPPQEWIPEERYHNYETTL